LITCVLPCNSGVVVPGDTRHGYVPITSIRKQMIVDSTMLYVMPRMFNSFMGVVSALF
jgi:hypothetical protein